MGSRAGRALDRARTPSRRPTSSPTPPQRGDDAKLLDELGDVLFQVHFLALLLEERGAGDLGEVADHCTQKLIRRHPHVFGEVEVSDAHEVLRNWDQIKQARGRPRAGAVRRGAGEPARLRSTRARCSAAPPRAGSTSPASRRPLQRSRGARASSRPPTSREHASTRSATCCSRPSSVARKLTVDPELALRAAAERFRGRVERGRRAGRIGGPKLERSRPGRAARLLRARRRHAQEDPEPDEPDRARPRPPDPRQPGQPDGRGRAERPLRRLGPGGGALRRVDRRVRGHRAARRRLGLARQGRDPARWTTSTARSPPRSAARTPPLRRRSTGC